MHEPATHELTRNQSLVMSVLDKADRPLSAYSILDQLRDKGLKAPLQIYRALDKLLELGMAHRLESLNAFIACRAPECETHEAIAFTICERCGQVDEISDRSLSRRLHAMAVDAGFSPSKSTVELRGRCHGCR